MSDERRDHGVLYADVTGLAAVGQIFWQCPVGVTARVIYWGGEHDEGAPLTTSLTVSDGITEVGLHEPVALASGVRLSLYEQTQIPECIILHAGGLISISAAVTGVHILTAHLIAELRRGEAT